VKVSALTGNSSKAGAKKPWPLLNETGQVQMIFRCRLDLLPEAQSATTTDRVEPVWMPDADNVLPYRIVKYKTVNQSVLDHNPYMRFKKYPLREMENLFLLTDCL